MNEKEFIKRITVCVLLVLLCAFAVFFIVGTRTNVHDNGYGTNKVRTELGNIEETQQEETRVIDETEKAITRGKERVDESARTNKSIEKLERTDGEIIDECQSILRRVRERNSSKD
ncbi:MAG: hypothetical protein QP733_01940 [Dialister micraerophilus]|uniref:hypothetical protein n=1 Tax=Dialister micraerophilus TaxID=309120 RepID=UPI00254B591B|nr:hypothetical protein [Dialister micraerophilus]MDK8253201.1 hypothetical protein [Dialister micraerophilus]